MQTSTLPVHILVRKTSGMPVCACDEFDEACFGQLSAPCYLGNALACRTYVHPRAGWILHAWQLFPRRRTCEEGCLRLLCRFHVRHRRANTSSMAPLCKFHHGRSHLTRAKTRSSSFLASKRTKRTAKSPIDGAVVRGPQRIEDRGRTDINSVQTRSFVGASLDLAFHASYELNSWVNTRELIWRERHLSRRPVVRSVSERKLGR